MSTQSWAERGLNTYRAPVRERQQAGLDPVVEAERRDYLARQAAREYERQARKAAGDPELVGRRIDPSSVQVMPLPKPDPFARREFMSRGINRSPNGGT